MKIAAYFGVPIELFSFHPFEPSPIHYAALPRRRTTVMTLLMDRFAATRLDRIAFIKVQPRAFRWIPLFVIAGSGYVLMARASSSPDRTYLIGWTLFYFGAFLVSFFLRFFGPAFSTESRPLDERS
jgi:hypothetical protein